MSATSDFFDRTLPEIISQTPELKTRVLGNFEFDIDGEVWSLELNGRTTITKRKASLGSYKIRCSTPTFEKLLQDPSTAWMLFSTEQLTVTNAQAALSLLLALFPNAKAAFPFDV